jgi:hypothetical protein
MARVDDHDRYASDHDANMGSLQLWPIPKEVESCGRPKPDRVDRGDLEPGYWL